jgi:hypothetical protein
MRPVLLAALALALPSAAQTTVTVTTDADAGAGSLRAAVDAVIAAGGGRIGFAIPGDGVHTIRLQSNLPVITVPVEIDGLTQPGAACDPLPTDLRIEIIGSDIPVTPGGPHRILVLTGGASTVRGVSVHGIPSYRDPGVESINSTLLRVEGDDNLVECNLVDVPAAGGLPEVSVRAVGLFVGTEASSDNVVVRNVVGAPALTTSVSGVRSRVQGNRVGWTGPDALTLAELTPGVSVGGLGVSVSGADAIVGGSGEGEGNLFAGRLTLTGTGHLVQGNWLGLDANGDPVDVAAGIRLGTTGFPEIIVPTDMQIGGSAPGAGNVAAFLDIDDDAQRITVQGNRFGTDATGMAVHPRAATSGADGTDVVIGGAGEGEGNQFVVGEDEDDTVSSFRASGLVIEGNRFGTDATGQARLGLGSVRVSSGTGNRIGGATTGAGNVIATGLTLSSETDPVVQRNHVGVDASGATAFEPADNFTGGISVFGGSGAMIGGTGGVGNVVTGPYTGISLSSTAGARVLGNRVATDAAGGRALSALPVYGVNLFQTSDGVIGGTESGAGNVITATTGGVRLSSAAGARVVGNRIGTNAAGDRALSPAPARGIDLYRSSDNEIGGAEPAAGNVIAGSSSTRVFNAGVRLSGGSDRNRVLGNWIGTAPGLEAAFPSEASGIAVDSSYQTVIGLPEAPNVVAHTAGPAVYVVDGGTGNAVSGLLAFATGLPVVDLDGTPEDRETDGLTPNDPADADDGPNRLQNAPEVAAASATDAAVAVTYAVDSDPSYAAYPLRVEALAVSPTSAVYLGHDEVLEAEAGATREATFALDAPLGGGTSLVLIATDADGNTGESSAPVVLTAPTSADDAPEAALFAVAAWPNPAADRLAVAVVGAEGAQVRVAVLDALGRRIATAEGARTELDVSGLAPGLYVVRAEARGRVATQAVTVAR